MEKAAAVCFFSFPEGKVTAIDPRIKEVASWPNIHSFELKLHVGDKVNKITSSLNRYGQFVVTGENRADLDELVDKVCGDIFKLLTVEF